MKYCAPLYSIKVINMFDKQCNMFPSTNIKVTLFNFVLIPIKMGNIWTIVYSTLDIKGRISTSYKRGKKEINFDLNLRILL